MNIIRAILCRKLDKSHMPVDSSDDNDFGLTVNGNRSIKDVDTKGRGRVQGGEATAPTSAPLRRV